MDKRLIIATIALIGQPALADTDRDALELVYQYTGGDQWHEQAGWMSADDPCTWYGVTCDETGAVVAVELPDNGLAGTLPDALGTMSALERLDLSANDIGGQIPGDWQNLQLSALNLAGNRIEGGILPALRALSTEAVVSLDLSDNQLSGTIPEEILALEFISIWDYALVTEPLPLLNLCGNELELPEDETLVEFVRDQHLGKAFPCDGQGQAITPAISGSWYDPERPGIGFSQMLLDNGRVVTYWYNFGEPVATLAPKGQFWQIGVSQRVGQNVSFEPLYWARGFFGQGMTESGSQSMPAHLMLRPISADQLNILYTEYLPSLGLRAGGLMYWRFGEQKMHVRLTRLAGSECHLQHPGQWISGPWYDPTRDGEGLVVEILPDGRGLVYWYTFTAEGTSDQAWMIGDGTLNGRTLVIDSMIQPLNGRFGPDFDPDQVEYVDWGRIQLTFESDEHAAIEYESNLDAFGSGQHILQRLARPMLAECD